MRRLELLIPPPLVMLGTGLIMWLLAKIFPGLTQAWLHSIMLAIASGALGLAISLAGIIIFSRASTTIDPREPAKTSTLVSSGIFHYSRNPMYLGVLLVLIGWTVYLGNLLSALCIVAFIGYITRYQIIPEERLLQEKFGAEFLAYKDRVRRWL